MPPAPTSARSYLPVDPAGARVVAIDAHGRPALLRHALGDGSTVLCTYPLEYMASQTPQRRTPRARGSSTPRSPTRRACAEPVRVDDPRVLAGVVRGGSGDLAVFVNSSDDALEVDPVTEDGAELALPEGGLELGPFAVATLRLSRPGGDNDPVLGVAGFPATRLRVGSNDAPVELLDTPDEGRDATG